MANGIGSVWAANAGNDEQKPNGVGSVWIENIEALTPSGGAGEEVNTLVQTNSATWNTVSDKLDMSSQVISSYTTGWYFFRFQLYSCCTKTK